ncbi:class I SAM-dependent methyltransferase [Acidaminobacter hydrogenoformans]|uniref:Methyltransferase domain-containing protein n=1 Tax=Acidaminobacter hydrogenoformans DSM 2784 TaxID=1120920 RepID=A0A1G5RWY7_9FIRM|nr:class I SAM-dependent methyltransferase [Acidaminobacter hydrogenoformans]SCZ78556.1 Methyltransferase domain-containing protein [Acidaminobacter hydrogenoformans DSM 2784]
MKQWYETLFENYGNQYDHEPFTQGTSGECDFIEAELGYDKSLKLLDIGCGTGRHAIDLTRRGYSVTGVDLSEAQLKKAREKALEEGLEVRFIKADARELPFEEEFDAALMLCEGGFPLMETDEMNFEILRNAAKALKRPGKLIFTTLNGLFPLFNSIDRFHEEGREQREESRQDDQGNEIASYKSEHFDLMTFRDHNVTTFTDDDGVEHQLVCSERYYVPSEITWLLKSLGFKTIEIFGAKLGAFSRADKLTKDDFEMLVIASI